MAEAVACPPRGLYPRARWHNRLPFISLVPLWVGLGTVGPGGYGEYTDSLYGTPPRTHFPLLRFTGPHANLILQPESVPDLSAQSEQLRVDKPWISPVDSHRSRSSSCAFLTRAGLNLCVTDTIC